MRRVALLALPLLLLGASPKPDPVAYTLSPEIKDGALQALDVEVRYTVGANGVSDFAWSPQWAGEKALWRWARDLKVEGAASVEHPSEGVWRIHAGAGEPVKVRYRVVSAYDHDPTGDDSDQPKPIIRPTWFYTTGHALFGAPRERPEDDPATFRWIAAGSGLRFASDLEHLALTSGTVGDVRVSILAGDRDLRVSGDLLGADKVRVAAVSGAYAFNFQAFDALARRIVHEERRFFGEDGSAPFLITMSPIKPGRSAQSFSGTGLGDAFALWLDRNGSLDEMRWLIAHEYFHTWNYVKLGGEGALKESAPMAWFSEGFTDYYARALLVRAGIIDPDAFARLWNRTLRDYAASPVRNASNSRIAAEFWSNEAMQTLPYQRGAQLAALWNAKLRRQTHGRLGLDDVIRAQYAWAKAHPNAKIAAPDLFLRIARTRFGFDLSQDVRRYVAEGQTIRLPSDVFGPCAHFGEARRPAFDRGFDPQATAKAGNVAQGVKPGSAAYAAGLRNGMTLLARDGGEPGESDLTYVLRVDDHGVQRTIGYLPRGEGTVMQTRLEITSDADSKRCAASMSGL